MPRATGPPRRSARDWCAEERLQIGPQLRVVAQPPPGDPDGPPPGERELEVAQAVGLEVACRLVAAAVELDDDALLRPDAVALVAADVEVAPRPGQVVGVEEGH